MSTSWKVWKRAYPSLPTHPQLVWPCICDNNILFLISMVVLLYFIPTLDPFHSRERLMRKQGRIHGHQLRTGGQERKCAFSHFSTRAHQRTNRRTDGRTDKASYRVACPQLKTWLSVTRNEPTMWPRANFFFSFHLSPFISVNTSFTIFNHIWHPSQSHCPPAIVMPGLLLLIMFIGKNRNPVVIAKICKSVDIRFGGV